MKKAFFLLSLIFCFSSVLYAKLLTHLEFEDSLEDSVLDNNGTFNGSAASMYSAGRNGRGLNFNGSNNYLEFGKGDFDPRLAGGRYSISLWVYATEQATSSNAHCYIGKHTSSGGNSILFGYWGQLIFQVGNSVKHFTSIENESVNTWVHYVISAMEQSGTTYFDLYKDGVLVESDSLSATAGSFTSASKPWVLGMDWDGSSKTDFFKGRMDDVRIYDWKLSADEVKEIYVKESSDLHLSFDGNFNDSTSLFTGSQTGGVLLKQGMENQSAYFDGIDDYVEFGTGTTDPRSVSVTNPSYSISLWVKSDDAATASNNNSYIAKHNASNGNIFLFGYWSGKLTVQIKNSYVYVSTSAEPTTWTHYVVIGTENSSAGETNIIVYKNGTQLWAGTIPQVMGSFATNYRPWVVGQEWDSSASDFFKGEIDNVRFYKRTLTASDVQALYRSEFSGVRYCNTDQNSAGCTFVNNTVQDLSQYSWLLVSGSLNGVPFYLPTFHTSIESIKVSEGWEAYLCTSSNHQGTCRYYDDGLYNSSDGLYSSLINNVYSMTVQPATFSAAKKFYGFRRADGSGNYPAGFAYLYEQTNFAAPSKIEFSRRRLFLNSYDRYNFSTNLPNSIIRTNYISSAELYGDVYLVVSNSTNGSKKLMTSHNDFNKNISGYPELDFRNYYHNTNSAILHGATEEVGSIGVFFSDDFVRLEYLYPFCLNGVFDTIDDNPTRIECVGYNPDTSYASNLPFYNSNNNSDNNDINKFWENIYGGNRQKLERYSDNYSLLMLFGHGNYSNSVMKIGVPHRWENTVNGVTYYYPHIDIYSDGRDSYSRKLGKQNTRWMVTSACQSMGLESTSMVNVGNVYYNILTRLNGIGGFNKNSLWNPVTYGTDYEDYLNDLTNSSKTISKAWVDSWSSNEIPIEGRDTRFLTLEKCSCAQILCISYMKSDYFYNVLTGPLAQKTDLTNYNYYCFRDKESNFDNYLRSSYSNSQNYPEEFVAYSYDSLPNYIVEQLFDVKIDESSAKFYGNDRYNYKDDYVILNRKDKNIQAVMNREMASFEDEREAEYMIEDKFNEAKEMAETLTSIKLEYAGISRDVNEAFEVGGNGESLGKMINSVAFVFRPVIDNIPVFSESIEVEYDAKGLYQVRSNIPYYIYETRRGKIKSEEQAEEEIYSALGKEEEKIITYVLNEDGEFVLSTVAKDEAKKTFLTISLAENHD